MSISWLLFFLLVGSLLVLDLGVLHKKNKVIGLSESLYRTLIYIIISCLFGTAIWHFEGQQAGMQFFSGYLVEKSLSMDNVFVISMVFSYLNIPRAMQHRILFWGIVSAILMRGIMIYLGAAMVHSLSWMLYIFGILLVFTGAKLLFQREEFNPANNKLMQFIKGRFNIIEDQAGEHFVIQRAGKWCITQIGLALIIIEVMDLVFAIDSIPAIFAITTDFYIVYTSNIFAILGLRSLYFALDHMAARFHYLRHALAIILIFIGVKIFIAHIWGEIPIEITLFFTVGCLTTGIALSALRKK